jgi:sorting nexin-41/42
MWDDEYDNNPYGRSFDRRDSETSDIQSPTERSSA